ncbi:UNVERIFIED_CONTAM: hypothetical protein PYX00_010686 [Menopon gallinae]|uniref:Uncharacterized protein n=1 Tax=Menopon gallinae TaxID=328185 RepID=A0AAW2HH07_9NEOP
MAELIFNNAFRFATLTLNYLSPSIIADIVLHPFDFATVLLQIGFDPEGLKNEATTLVSALAQYALFTFYIPYLFTSMQGVQFMGLPHPSMFYYVTYIYNKEGILGCYRGLLPKICERMVMMYVNETLKQAINGERRSGTDSNREQEDEKFIQSLVNNLCSQFFAVLASHPFHVIMVSSFAEFMYERKSSMFALAQFIYDDDGLYGFFIGLAPRLIGELFSLTFSQVYTGLVNKQIRGNQTNVSLSQSPAPTVTPSIVRYLTEVSRYLFHSCTTSSRLISISRWPNLAKQDSAFSKTCDYRMQIKKKPDS